MATGRITKRSVEAAPVPSAGKRTHLWDETLKGFGVMVTDRGVRSYIVQYRVGGRGSPTRRVTIGKHGSPWTAERARDRAAALLEQVRLKVDPFDAQRKAAEAGRAAEEQRKAQVAISERLGFSTFADRWIEKYAKRHRPRTWQEAQRAINKDLKPVFGDRPLTTITDADIVELIDEMAETRPIMAHTIFGLLRVIFKYACDKERRHLPPSQNPMLGLSPPPKSAKRERVLTDDELRLVWICAGELGWPFGPIVRLLILTGQRRDEVGGIAWFEIDKTDRSWLLPGERTKNKLPNFVPFSEPAMTIIEAVPETRSNTQLLFTTTGHSAVSGYSRAKLRLNELVLERMREEAAAAGKSSEEIEGLKVEHWILHDLRRTLATGCQQLNFPTEIPEAIINHQSGTKAGIVGNYQLYKYAKEKRLALDLWGRRVLEIAAGINAKDSPVLKERAL